jgi:hypothetical protein
MHQGSSSTEPSLLFDGESQTDYEDLSSSPPAAGVTDPELDGDDSDPIAICGFSIKFPQDATSPENFWKMMIDRRCAMTEFPEDRINPKGFYQKKAKVHTASRTTPAEL